jgi:hypothetical protein
VPIFIQQLGVRSSDMNAQTTANTMFTDLAGDSIGWTWWTYREKGQPNGGGYAPFYLDANNLWQEDKSWLSVIASQFQ